MRTLIPALAILLVVGCAPLARTAPAPLAEPVVATSEPGPVARVREALMLGGVAREFAEAPRAVLPNADPRGAALVVGQRGRWWVFADGRVAPADEYAERLAEELFARAQ